MRQSSDLCFKFYICSVVQIYSLPESDQRDQESLCFFTKAPVFKLENRQARSSFTKTPLSVQGCSHCSGGPLQEHPRFDIDHPAAPHLDGHRLTVRFLAWCQANPWDMWLGETRILTSAFFPSMRLCCGCWMLCISADMALHFKIQCWLASTGGYQLGCHVFSEFLCDINVPSWSFSAYCKKRPLVIAYFAFFFVSVTEGDGYK